MAGGGEASELDTPEAVYEAAAKAYDGAVNASLGNPPGSVLGEQGRQLWREHAAFGAAVRAAYAAGRAKAAEDIRAEDPPRVATLRGTFVTTYSVREWAARIAESSTVDSAGADG